MALTRATIMLAMSLALVTLSIAQAPSPISLPPGSSSMSPSMSPSMSMSPGMSMSPSMSPSMSQNPSLPSPPFPTPASPTPAPSPSPSTGESMSDNPVASSPSNAVVHRSCFFMLPFFAGAALLLA